MLASLSIRDIVLIRSLDLSFRQGLTVLTGETGAGKSILLDSLSLAMGARGDGDLVRVGATQGSVTAMFDVAPSHPVFEWLRENDLVAPGAEGEGILLRRTQNADGRTRAYVNDRPVSVATLRTLGQRLVEIHGQHEERAMIDPAAHRDLVDAFGGLSDVVAGVAAAHGEWRAARRALDELRARVARAAKEADYLRAAVEELTTLDPQEGEEEDLAGKRQQMMAAERIASDLSEAHEVLAGQASPMPTLVSTMRALERKAAGAPGLLEGAVESFGKAIDALSSAEQELETALRLSEFDPHELESAEERLFALRAASRKYDVPVEGLQAHAARLTEDLSDLDAGEERLGELERLEREAFAVLRSRALDLAERRAEAAEALSARVMAELPALKLDQARFFANQTVNEEEIGADGCDVLEFHVQTNPGTRPGPLMKVASGGELSRFLLALKVALADRGSAPTLVFDEIDTGVGGAVADAIGARLGTLSNAVQVLSVTHAPQVAARALDHLLIAKTGGEETETRVTPLDEQRRREEIARMLSGAEVTSEARAAADRLMKAG